MIISIRNEAHPSYQIQTYDFMILAPNLFIAQFASKLLDGVTCSLIDKFIEFRKNNVQCNYFVFAIYNMIIVFNIICI